MKSALHRHTITINHHQLTVKFINHHEITINHHKITNGSTFSNKGCTSASVTVGGGLGLASPCLSAGHGVYR